MSIFSKIMDKLGFGKDQVEEVKKETASAEAKAKSAAYATLLSKKAADLKKIAEYRKPVDVEAQLEAMAKAAPEKLNWKVSIVDLMKLVGIDSSYENRVELAKELGIPDDVIADSAKMNTQLHKIVLKKLAANGGKVPADLLD